MSHPKKCVKIMIVEDDTDYRDNLVDAFNIRSRYTYLPYIFKKCSDAPKAQEAGEYDLALVDRRAEHPDRSDDNSGLEYALDLERAGTRAVLVTAYPDEAHKVFELLRRGALTGVVNKKSVDVYPLLLGVEHFLEYGTFLNGIVQFGWLGRPPADNLVDPSDPFPSASWQYLKDRLNIDPRSSLGELELLLRNIISPCATKIRLKPCSSQGQSGTLLLQAEVTGIDAPVREDLAIKLGKKWVVKDEMLRYDRFVGPLPDGAAAQLRFRAETEHLAAIAYSWVGDSVEEGVSFADLNRSDDDIMGWRVRRKAVRRLFATTLHRWYTVYRESGDSLADSLPSDAPKDLWGHYTMPEGVYPPDRIPNYDNLPLYEVKEQIVAGAGQSWTFQFGNTTEKLPDPVDWARKKGRITLARLCPCHGDMHVGNVYVLPDSSPRLIDFGRTDLSHVFRDFAALEASIRMTCVGTPGFALIKRAEDILGEVNSLGDAIDYEELNEKDKEKAPLREALRVTNVIRRAALDAYVGTGKDAMQEYLFALVMHLLRYAADVADECKADECKARNTLEQPGKEALMDCDEWFRRQKADAVLKRKVCVEWFRQKADAVLERRARRIWAAHYAAAKAAKLAIRLSTTQH